MRAVTGPTSGDCLLFDYGGTLDSDGVAWKERFQALYRDEGLELPAYRFDRLFYDADDALVGTLDKQADLAETVRQLVGNIEQAATQALGADPQRLSRVADAFLEASHATLRRNRATLEALRRRYQLGIVSNFYGNLAAVCHGLGLDDVFDAIADSERVGVGKPDAAIFRAAMDPLGARPETTVMIGDSLRRDGDGARGCGLRFVWIAPVEAQDAAGGSQIAIARLDQLAELLL
ncbi:MAG: putative HAD-superfamily hydrolase, subfamily variant 3 [Alphaproteobacteria bacterium]|nr:putative HAD-superfamily hydrolase, subfamily variant 3 [Alphaproteobacteria bacterium]